MKIKLFSYNQLDTPIHNLSGLTKVLAFLLLTFAVMFSYDIRLILAMLLFSIWVFSVAQIKWHQIKLMVIYVLVFLITNVILTFMFEPEYGVKIYGTRHLLFNIIGPYTVTAEQLLYQVTKVVKYASVIPFGIVFLLTTNPSELASSLNRVGIHYKIAYPVSLTLRYFPDIQRNYNDISQAQQARGLEMSKKASLPSRFKNALLIIIPLIFSTIDRIDVISNAMDLRGFGKGKKRSWYSAKKLKKADYIALTVSLLAFLLSIFMSVVVNGSRFYNPFI